MSAVLSLLLLLASPAPPPPDAGSLSLDAQLRLNPPDGGLPLAMPPLPFVWELPPKAMHEVPIDGTTYVQGVPVRLRYVMVNDTPENVGQHFRESFIRQGLFIDAGQRIDRMLTGVDPRAFITYTVVLQPNAPGYTTVILGEAKPLQKKAPTAGGLPVPPGAKRLVPVQFEGYQLVTLRTSQPADEVKVFYARELPLRGYQPLPDGAWQKPGERLEVSVSADHAGTKVVLKQSRGLLGGP